MRNILKAATLESKFPLLSVEHDCIISKDADLTVAYKVELPELFSVTSAEYEAIHASWLKNLSKKLKRTLNKKNMNILETRIFYLKGQICRVVVLVDFTSVGKPYSDIRAIEATNKPCSGYEFIKPNETLSDDLINRIAALGMEINPDDVFPNWKNEYK